MKNNNNLVITPHIGGVSKEAMLLTERIVYKKFLKLIGK